MDYPKKHADELNGKIMIGNKGVNMFSRALGGVHVYNVLK